MNRKEELKGAYGQVFGIFMFGVLTGVRFSNVIGGKKILVLIVSSLVMFIFCCMVYRGSVINEREFRNKKL